MPITYAELATHDIERTLEVELKYMQCVDYDLIRSIREPTLSVHDADMSSDILMALYEGVRLR